jgi:hypothetical protein
LVQVATNYTPRFVSFALMPLLTLAAVALVGLARFARIRQGMSVAVACGLVAFALLALGRFARYAAGYATTPIEASSTAAEIVDGATGSDVPRLVLANRAMPSIMYYFDERRAHSPRALISLDREFCSYNGSLAFLDEQGYAQPSLSCLMRRGAFEIKLGQQRTPFALWLVPPKSL